MVLSYTREQCQDVSIVPTTTRKNTYMHTIWSDIVHTHKVAISLVSGLACRSGVVLVTDISVEA